MGGGLVEATSVGLWTWALLAAWPLDTRGVESSVGWGGRPCLLGLF